MKNNLVFYLKWFATFITIVGAVCTALNIYPASPILLSIGSVVWLVGRLSSTLGTNGFRAEVDRV